MCCDRNNEIPGLIVRFTPIPQPNQATITEYAMIAIYALGPTASLP
jgi:hypothetical protein